MKLVTFERLQARRVSATARAALLEGSGGVEGLEDPPALGRRIGALTLPDEVVDLNRALALKFAVDDAGAPEAEADSLLPVDPSSSCAPSTTRCPRRATPWSSSTPCASAGTSPTSPTWA